MKKDTHNKAYEDTYEVLSRSIFFIFSHLLNAGAPTISPTTTVTDAPDSGSTQIAVNSGCLGFLVVMSTVVTIYAVAFLTLQAKPSTMFDVFFAVPFEVRSVGLALARPTNRFKRNASENNNSVFYFHA
ncbi:hypothetical protein DPMN_128917 [Dreissena polymorpha]|uniref:Uncharacterized protein n=1 Tax=Dreissena polymorpha TaxID=45954 RepID=A0A9D4H0B2_DREPO|nr:hypothetical protein DPMN_128917 [Dreissena polymorpha]